MSQAPAEVWIRRSDGGYYRTMLEPPEPSAVRYVRADLYEGRQGRTAESKLDAVVRTKADPNRSRREDKLVAEIERLEVLVSGLQARMDVVRSWNEAPCLEPLPALGSDDIEQRQRND